MDRERIQKWIEESTRADFTPEIHAHTNKANTDRSRVQTNPGKEQLLQNTDPMTSQNEPPVISAFRRPRAPSPGQETHPFEIKRLVLHAESALDFALAACAALIPMERPAEPRAQPSMYQPSTAMIFSQYAKSRRSRLQPAAGASDDISSFSTASAFSASQRNGSSVYQSASSRGGGGGASAATKRR